ncbi:MAG: CRISPR-associated protein Cas4 [Caldilineaceae bacterium]
MPTSEVIYSDTNTWQRVERPLLSRRYGLVGKPDYVVVVEEGRRRSTIPVEVKSGKSPAQPHLGHLRQLGVYCLLVEETYGQTPTHGLLQYADATLRIPFTAELRRDVLAITAEIQQAHSARNVARNHNEPARCRSCGYREACGKAALS